MEFVELVREVAPSLPCPLSHRGRGIGELVKGSMEDVDCLLCHSHQSTQLFSQYDVNLRQNNEMFRVVRCIACGLIYLNPRPTPTEILRYYPEHYYALQEAAEPRGLVKAWSHRLKQAVREEFYGYPKQAPRVRSMIGPRLHRLTLYPVYWHLRVAGQHMIPFRGEGRILDVGCGPGTILRNLRRQGWDSYGVELSPAAVERAHSHGLKVICGELLQAGFRADFFDVVFFNHSLEHMHHPLEILAEVKRVLKSGGLLMIKIPNAASFEARLFGKWWIGWDVPRHLYHFTTETISRLLRAASFRLLDIKYGVSSAYFRKSMDAVYKNVLRTKRRHGSICRHVLAGPLCRLAGTFGYGSEMIVYAEKPASLR